MGLVDSRLKLIHRTGAACHWPAARHTCDCRVRSLNFDLRSNSFFEGVYGSSMIMRKPFSDFELFYPS
jgi:hypothetical protein